VGVSHDLRDTGKSGDLTRRPLGVTPGDDDASIGIFAMHAADSSTCVLVRRCGDRAGVQDDNPGFVGPGSSFQATLIELTLDRGTVSLGGPASKIVYVVRCHRTIVAALLTEVVGRQSSFVRRFQTGLSLGGFLLFGLDNEAGGLKLLLDLSIWVHGSCDEASGAAGG